MNAYDPRNITKRFRWSTKELSREMGGGRVWWNLAVVDDQDITTWRRTMIWKFGYQRIIAWRTIELPYVRVDVEWRYVMRVSR